MIRILKQGLKTLFGKPQCLVNFATYRLNYGQGGQCKIDLRNPNYNYKLQFETIWEDHCIVEVDEIYDSNQLTILQEGNKTTINDNFSFIQPIKHPQKLVNIKFRIPEDYTFYGEVNGSIKHLKSNVSNKLRCNETNIKLLGKDRLFQFGNIQSPNLHITTQHGAIDINSLTFEDGDFFCNSFCSKKVLFSRNFNLKAKYLTSIRSVVTYGNAVANISSKFTQIQSISGTFQIECEKIKIDRIWASPQGIKIKTKKIQKVGIETGSGFIESEEELDQNWMDKIIRKGKLFKGKITKIGEHKILIQ